MPSYHVATISAPSIDPRICAAYRRQAGEAMRRALTLELQAPLAHTQGDVVKASRMLAQACALRCEYERLSCLASPAPVAPMGVSVSNW